MPFSYKPLWKQLVDLDMTRKEFAKMSGISVSTLTRMGRNDYISLKIVDDICSLLNCTPNDVMEHVTEEELKNEKERNRERLLKGPNASGGESGQNE